MNIYIDPGKHKSALAGFDGGRLQYVLFTVPALIRELRFGIEAAVIENPRINAQTRGKDPNDMMDLAMTVGSFQNALLVGGVEAELVEPATWKGQIKKPLHHRRIWATLSEAEKNVFAAGSGRGVDFVTEKIEKACRTLAIHQAVRGYSWEAHNLLDAVGLGLWHLKRIGRAGVRHSNLLR